MRLFPAEHTGIKKEEIQNTAGAGDTFRGAFLFALLQSAATMGAAGPNSHGDPRRRLERCTAFAVRCAAERCRTYKMTEALDLFGSNGAEWWQEILTKYP